MQRSIVGKLERSLCSGTERGNNGKAEGIEVRSGIAPWGSLNRDSAGKPLTHKLDVPFLMSLGAFCMRARHGGKKHFSPLGPWTSGPMCP